MQGREAELEAIVVMVEEEWVREALWGVQTSADAPWGQVQGGDAARATTPQVHFLHDAPSHLPYVVDSHIFRMPSARKPILSALVAFAGHWSRYVHASVTYQQCAGALSGPDVSANFVQALAENAVLARALLEGVGVCARALGRRFAAGGRVMYTVLIPLMERLADPSPSVAAAAAAAVGSICLHCGYGGLEELVRANAHHVVEGLCRQLRHLDSHPRCTPRSPTRVLPVFPAALSHQTNCHLDGTLHTSRTFRW